jgi:hypothetical protein
LLRNLLDSHVCVPGLRARSGIMSASSVALLAGCSSVLGLDGFRYSSDAEAVHVEADAAPVDAEALDSATADAARDATFDGGVPVDLDSGTTDGSVEDNYDAVEPRDAARCVACDSGAALPSTCQAGTNRCAESTPAVERCVDGLAWTSIPCTSQACVNGACIGECTPGLSRCASPTVVETCSALGSWQPTSCSQQACVNGVCSGTCSPGASRCIDSASQQVCANDGEVWSRVVDQKSDQAATFV